jgi:hypothetical protein
MTDRYDDLRTALAMALASWQDDPATMQTLFDTTVDRGALVGALADLPWRLMVGTADAARADIDLEATLLNHLHDPGPERLIEHTNALRGRLTAPEEGTNDE